MNPFVGYKILRFPERIAEWMRTGRTSGPIVVDFDLTNRCPHNCPACPGDWRRDPSAQWKLIEAKDVLRQFRDLGTRAISFGGGGDPLAHPDAEEILQYTVSLGMSVGVITNGAIVRDPEQLARICKWIRVSLDAATPERFAAVHGVPESHFETILDNIKRLTSVPHTGCIIGVGFLTNEEAAQEIVPAACLAKETGADYIQYRPFNFDGFNPTELVRQAGRLYDGEEFAVLASWPKYELMGTGILKPYRRCHVHHFTAVVTATKEMHFCCDMRYGDGKIGDLSGQSVAEIWASAKRDALADDIDLSKCPPLCRGNAQNIVLDRIAEPLTHEEFL